MSVLPKVMLAIFLFNSFCSVIAQSELDFVDTHSLQREKDSKKSPNVIVIMVDDLSVADISLNGNSLIETPNIDRIAKQGVNFTNAYVSSPVCSPSRASFITGQYAQRFGFQFQMHERYPKSQLEYLGFKWFVKSYPWIPKKMKEIPNEEQILRQGLPNDIKTLPQFLKEVGYSTGLIGKWHLGWHSSNEPCNYGFDYQYGFYGSHSLYVEEKSKGYVDQKVKKDFTDKHIWKGQRVGPHAIYKNCEVINESGYLTDRITEESIEFIAHQNSPFFLWVSYNAPHSPFQCKQEHYDKVAYINDPIKRVYNAMILSLDENIGRLLDYLEDNGLLEETVVFFMSDNGGAEYTFATDNGQLKGGKITDLEGGVKVPFFMMWKGELPRGLQYDKPIVAMDAFTTISEVSGVDQSDLTEVDGVNLLPFIKEQKSGYPHDYIFWQRGISRAVRDERFKLLINDLLQDTVLFDLHLDPHETKNVLKDNPEKAKQLISALNLWSATLPKPMWPAVIYYEFMDGEQRYLFDQ
jgi:arylsulfatase A-like enzyme